MSFETIFGALVVACILALVFVAAVGTHQHVLRGRARRAGEVDVFRCPACDALFKVEAFAESVVCPRGRCRYTLKDRYGATGPAPAWKKSTVALAVGRPGPHDCRSCGRPEPAHEGWCALDQRGAA